MNSSLKRYQETPLVKTKIVATVGPACWNLTQLTELVKAGVDVFRLNCAHGEHAKLTEIVASIREASRELDRPIGILSDLAGPKIRLGELVGDQIDCLMGEQFEFIRGEQSASARQLTCTYSSLIDDVKQHDLLLLADGTVGMRVVEKVDNGNRLVCEVERPGTIRSRQGINLPGVVLSTPSLTEKDCEDLAWALDHEIDYVGLSFVRSANDIRLLRQKMTDHKPRFIPHIVAKIEKLEAFRELEQILDETDAVMVARGDLGVEVDLPRVPILQKQIIRLCNQRRVPVITATQMLDSMQVQEMPTRAEASDVANAILDGSDAVMLSGETAVGKHPVKAVEMMSRIAMEAERLVVANQDVDHDEDVRHRAREITEAVTLGAGTAAQYIGADLVVVCSHTGKSALAMSKQRLSVPVVALSDLPETARRMCLYWGVTAIESKVVQKSPTELRRFIVDWGLHENVLAAGSKIVMISGSRWSSENHDMMLVHSVPADRHAPLNLRVDKGESHAE
ncbi:MAG: pyruvate kinase [Planctomycetota bacterium]|nr:pyruvate kinase [Planctomycetota bacterium]MDA1211728.1 pyruvate kinase [Planctomycetota bacterium]